MINRTARQMFVIVLIGLVLIATNVAHTREAITDGLVSYWSFNKDSIAGKTVKDLFGANSGTMNGDVEVVNGKIGEALKFSGGHVDCGADKSLTEIGAQITLDMRIKPEKPGWAIIAGLSRSGSNTYVIAWSDRNQVDFNIWNGAVETWPFQSVGQLELDKWHHIAGVYDGAEAIIYINGEEDSKKEFEGALKDNGENFWMGDRKAGLPFNGLLDELRIYNRGLSQAEIKNNLDAVGLAVVEPTQKLTLTWGAIKISKSD